LVPERRSIVEPLDQEDVALVRYLRRAYDCRLEGAVCPGAADCAEGFLICDALVNMLEPGTSPELGHTAKQIMRFLYENLDCDARADCPAATRCNLPAAEPCRALLRKLGVAMA
jgi:hypothetical protein